MASYKAPGVYVEDITSGSQSIEQASSSVGVLIGTTRSGVVNSPQKVTSWTDFINKFANGLDTPFSTNMYLPYSVYGFFNNGGSELYVISLKKSGVKATKTTTGSKLTITASTEGAWGNDISLTFVKASDWVASTNLTYDVTIKVGSGDSVTLNGETIDTIADDILANFKAKEWISAVTLGESAALAEEVITLEGGSDGTTLTDSDYISALDYIDLLEDAMLVGIPGQTSSALNLALMQYCEKNWLFPMLDAPVGSTVDAVKTYRKTVSSWTGCIAYPWGKVLDPLTNDLKLIPTVGHLMGVYARVFTNRGIFKAPAGLEAVVNGFVELEKNLTPGDIGTLNSVGVICIRAMPNAGIVVWGARSLNSTDTTMRYVTDGIMNLVIKRSLDRGTAFAVFEPNNEVTWNRLDSSCRAFLETLRLEGAFKGTKDTAYYVTVNDTNNTDATIAEGILNVEVGYAPVKPAEFVVIKLAHSIVGNAS